MTASESTVRTAKKIPIIINGQQFKVEVPILGSALRDLGQIPAENQLFEERPGPEPDILIDPGASYEPKPGAHYYDLPRGTVGSAARAEQLAYLAEQLTNASQEDAPDGSSIVRWTAQLSEGWSPASVSLLLLVPPAYPQQAPSGFDAVGPVVQVGGGAPAGSGSNTVAGSATTHFCWNPAGAIDYASREGLWRFAKFAEQRFRQ